jgi:hypothetical protein
MAAIQSPNSLGPQLAACSRVRELAALKPCPSLKARDHCREHTACSLSYSHVRAACVRRARRSRPCAPSYDPSWVLPSKPPDAPTPARRRAEGIMEVHAHVVGSAQ